MPGPRAITKQEEFLVGVYRGAMTEIKQRYKLVQAVAAPGYPLPSWVRHEFCALQARLITETLALSCLAAQGHIQATKGNALQKAYDAEYVIAQLLNIHQDALPIPLLPPRTPNEIYMDNPPGPQYLQREEIATFYPKLGGMLHVGSLKRTLRQEARQPKLDEIVSYLDRLYRRLRSHLVVLMDHDLHYVCEMQSLVQDDVEMLLLVGAERVLNPPKYTS